MKKIFINATKAIAGQKCVQRLLLTAVAAFLMLFVADFIASVIREMVAYHTVGTFVALFVGSNALLSRKKLKGFVKRLKKMWDMGEGDEKVSSSDPASGKTFIADIAKEFAAAVNNGAPEEEEVFED